MMSINTPPEDDYSEILFQDYLERKKEERVWYKNLPTTLVAVVGIIGILLVVIFVKQVEDYSFYVIVGGIALIVILVSLGRSLKGKDYLSEPEAIRILKEYLSYKKELVPSLAKSKCEPTGVCQLWEWDTGQGMQPWRYIVPWNSVDGYNTERWIAFIDPYNGKVIGHELLTKTYLGMEKPHLKLVYGLMDRVKLQTKYDASHGRSKW